MAHAESLESRRLLAATLEGGVLVVMGRSFSEDILIREDFAQNGDRVIAVDIDAPKLDIPATHQEFPLDQVKTVLVRSGGGNDLVDLAIATYAVPAIAGIGPVRVGSRVDGGSGNDRVYGGWGPDLLLGNIGNDQVFGMVGNDRLDGGRGEDDLHGGNDNDVVWGGLDDDRLAGDFGNDILFGGYGDDWLGSVGVGPLPNEPGDDILAGGGGNDSVLGGAGNDHISGGAGRDTFFTDDSPSEWLDKQPDEPVINPPPFV